MERAEVYLEKIPMWAKKKHSLEDGKRFLHCLGDPQEKIPAVHVAGTNGKGSVCAFLSSVLKTAGYRVGTFISPHLVDIKERFLIDGESVGEEEFQRAFETVLSVWEDCREREDLCHPTYFEFLFYMAMVLFREQQVDLMVLETGMGGRLDITNVIRQPLACVITSISLDHTMYLGDTLEEIAGEKAGIIKEGVPVIYDGNCPEAETVILRHARERKALSYRVSQEDFRVCFLEPPSFGEELLTVEGSCPSCLDTFQIQGRCLNHLEESPLCLTIPFHAFYQGQNAMLAARTLEVLRRSDPEKWRITDQQLQEGIRRTSWPGRMERVGEGIYLDGAHNPGGIQAFIQTAARLTASGKKKAYLLFAAVSDKDYREMASLLGEGMAWEAVAVVHIKSQRGLSSQELVSVFKQRLEAPVFSYEDTETAVKDMIRRKGDGLLFCVGSLYLIGEIKAAFIG